MKVKLIVEGGNMKPGPAVAQQLGPLGINIGKLIGDVNSATSGFKGMDIPVELDVDTKTKNYIIKVSSPSIATFLKKELGLEKGSGTAGSFQVGNIPFERVVDIAKTKQSSLLAKNLKSSIKLVVGTCVSLGIFIDSKPAKDIEKEIDSGVYDKEINNEITQPSPEKVKQLKEFYLNIKDKQDKAMKALAEAKAAEEAAKATAAPAAGAATAPVAKKEEPKKEKKK